MLLYTVYVRPHLEYKFVQVWAPYFQKEINTLGRVQQRTTKHVKSLKKKRDSDVDYAAT